MVESLEGGGGGVGGGGRRGEKVTPFYLTCCLNW